MDAVCHGARGASRGAGGTPVGAVLVQDEQIVAEGWNISVCHHDPHCSCRDHGVTSGRRTAAELSVGEYSHHVTLEPCTMCAGALVHGRISRLVYGASDLKTGAVRSVFLLNDPRHNHQIAVTAGVLADECSQQLSAFFQKRRKPREACRARSAKVGAAIRIPPGLMGLSQSVWLACSARRI